MNYSAKNKAIVSAPSPHEAHAYATYAVDKKLHGAEIFEEIAIGQTLGAWDERFVDARILNEKVAKIVSFSEDENHLRATIAFPIQLWHGRLSWLMTLVFGKMSFYRGVILEALNFDEACFRSGSLRGPQLTIEALRKLTGANNQRPLLMGILKPNVAMSPEALADLYCEVAQAGVNLVKDDEIRHDLDLQTTLKRVSIVANRKAKENLKTLYVAHAPINAAAQSNLHDWSRQLQDAGADALLINVWTAGLETLQTLREVSSLPLVAHPALVGAMGQGLDQDAICPSVTLGGFIRAAGGDLSLFPSPYGKIGLPKRTALKVARVCSEAWPAAVQQTIAVPSAGIKPEHVALACEDFGRDFILNAGTAIFASGRSVADSAKDFLTRMEDFSRAR